MQGGHSVCVSQRQSPCENVGLCRLWGARAALPPLPGVSELIGTEWGAGHSHAGGASPGLPKPHSGWLLSLHISLLPPRGSWAP